METTKKNNETLLDGAKIAGKWMKDTNSAMTDIYDRQVHLTTKYYNDFLDSILGGNKNLEDNRSFTDLLFSDEFAKGIWNPFNTKSSSFSTPIMGSLDKTYKQMVTYNQDILSNFNKIVKGNQTGWASISGDYVETIENQLETAKNVLKSLSDAYNKQIELSFETNKNVIEELNNQFNSIIKQNQIFLSDLLKTSQVFSEGEEKKTKEHYHNETKEHHTTEAKKHSHVKVGAQ